MGINLGSGFGNLTGNTSNNAPTGGILNLNKNDILDLTKRNPWLKRVMLGAGWDISNNGSDFDLDIAAFLLDANNKFNTVSNVIFFAEFGSMDSRLIKTNCKAFSNSTQKKS